METVLDVVESIPVGHVMTYGDVARVVAEILGRGGPRQVGSALRQAGAAVPWWRVVRASGLPAERLIAAAAVRLRAEGCPFADGDRVDLRHARLPVRDVFGPGGTPGQAVRQH